MKMNGEVLTTPFTFFGVSNRVEHQKLNQVAAWAATWLSFYVQHAFRQTQILIKTKKIKGECHQLYYYCVVILLQSSNDLYKAVIWLVAFFLS